MRRILLIALFASFFLCNSVHVSFAQATWTHRNLYLQGSDLYSISAFPNGLAVCVGENGAIERSTDTGKTWALQTVGELTLNGVASFDGNHFVAVSSEGKLIISNDSGATWPPNNYDGLPPLYSVAALDSTSFIAVGIGGLIVRSPLVDGVDWLLSSSATAHNLNSVIAMDVLHILACGDSGTIQRSEDGGNTWDTVSSRISANLRHLALRPDGEVFAYGDEWTVIMSTDSGKTWQNTFLDSTNSSKYPRAAVRNILFFSRTHGFAFVAQDPYVMLNDYVTDDGGLTWKIDNTIIDNNDDDAAAAAIDAVRALKVGQAGGIYSTIDQGNSWTQVNSQLFESYGGLAFSDVDNGFAITSIGLDVIDRTTDAGFDWSKGSTTPSKIEGILFPNVSVGFAYGSDFILRTIDSGSSWETIDSTNIGDAVSISFSSPANGALLASPPSLMITMDSGSSWKKLQLPHNPPNNLASITLLGTDTLILLGGNEVFRTFNGGIDWDSTSLAYTGNNMSFARSDVGWIVGTVTLTGQRFGSVILNSTDAGTTWATQFLDTTNLDFAGQKLIAVYDQSNVITSITAGTILETHDGGNSWIEDTTVGIPSNDQPVGISYPSVNTAYVLSGVGGVLYTGIFVTASVKPQIVNLSDLIPYPNPATNRISITNPNGALSIIDPLGRSYEVKQSGSTLDISSLPYGVYFISDGVSRAKFVKE